MTDLNEKCAVFGIFGSNGSATDIARETYFGLFALQHRGQEHSGIATTDGNEIHLHKADGLVSQIYTEDILKRLPGFAGIGHNRYSTSKGGGAEYAQPFLFHDKFALGHNGNLPSVKALVEFLESRGQNTENLSDSQLMVEAIGVYLNDGHSLPDAIEKAYPLFTGAFSCVVLGKETLIAFRDPCGIRPLALGRRENEVIISSETCAIDTIGGKFERRIEPGEMVVVTRDGIQSRQIAQPNPKMDIFEFVYFARHDSTLMGKLVYDVRKNLGKNLALESPKDVDLVIPVPETAIPAAMGYASAIGRPFEMALSKNRYIHRTFIQPMQSARDNMVRMKLIPLRQMISGKRVAIVDDSIVRGTTSRQIVKMLFDAGAKEVHFLVSSAPIRFPDFYGIDTPNQQDLIASRKTLEETRQYLGATSLSYLSIDGMIKATGLPRENFSLSAFDGIYPLDIHERVKEINYDIPKE